VWEDYTVTAQTQVSATPWSISGTYLEACNCDAICPCRRIDGSGGGRSTYGECTGSLSWRIEQGMIGDLDVGGLCVVMVIWYSDDQPRSPWNWVLHLDERADGDQRRALEDVYTGRLGGTALEQFPWAFKPSNLLEVVSSRIEIDHTPGRGWFRVGRAVTVRVREPFRHQGTVSCVIPGHHQAGREVVAELLEADDEHFRFTFTGRCGYEAAFAYAGP
jgi:hypothetical protein